jgi:hypothetical protein
MEVRRLWFFAVVAVAVVATAGCGGGKTSRTYSVEEVMRAFAGVRCPVRHLAPLPAGSSFLFPAKRCGSLNLIVGPNKVTDEEWRVLHPASGKRDFRSSFVARRANVLAECACGLRSEAGIRIRSAMNALPDRGFPLEVRYDQRIDERIRVPRGDALLAALRDAGIRRGLHARRICAVLDHRSR